MIRRHLQIVQGLRSGNGLAAIVHSPFGVIVLHVFLHRVGGNDRLLGHFRHRQTFRNHRLLGQSCPVSDSRVGRGDGNHGARQDGRAKAWGASLFMKANLWVYEKAPPPFFPHEVEGNPSAFHLTIAEVRGKNALRGRIAQAKGDQA